MLALGLAPLGLAAVLGAVSACSTVGPDEEVALTADELEALAVPGVDESAMDRSVDPCSDFYQFACGGYIASLPADTVREVRSFTQLQKSQSAIFAQVVAQIRSAPRPGAETKAAAYLKSCLAEPNPTAVSTFFEDRRKGVAAAVTSPAGIARLLADLHRGSVYPFFYFMPGSESREGAVEIWPGGADRRTDYTTDEGKATRIAALAKALRSADTSLAEDGATEIATAAVRVETAIAAAIKASADDERPHPVGRRGLESAAPHIDWAAYFGSFERTRFGDFNVPQLGYFAALDRILTETSPADLAAYLRARMEESAVKNLIVDPANREQACTRQLQSMMSDAIETPFLEAAGVDARAQAKARALFRAIVDAFHAELQHQPFLDVPTRVEAETKLAKMRAAIGGSRRLDDYADADIRADDLFAANQLRLLQRDFDQGLARVGRPIPLLHVDFPSPIVNASYDGSRNKINVPGGILGGYFFSAAAKPVSNFAAIGSVLGHELTHGFDSNGRHLDGDGNERDWWTPAVDADFRERSQCMIDQYGAFTLEGVVDPVTGTMPGHVNGKLTLGENIADNGGMKAAYFASKVEDRTGPMVAGFTPAQQFFITYGQLWCGKASPESAASSLAKDPHSPSAARVNVPLQNFEAFAKAFQCAPGKPMAPENRCRVW